MQELECPFTKSLMMIEEKRKIVSNNLLHMPVAGTSFFPFPFLQQSVMKPDKNRSNIMKMIQITRQNIKKMIHISLSEFLN